VAEHSLIADYRAALAAGLPAELADEVIDGLIEADAKYRQQGLNAESAAQAAITEFGEPSLVIEEFTRTAPAKRIARRLMVTGPVVGLCWGAALIDARAWQWPVPGLIRLVLGAVLAASVTVLVIAVLARRYRRVHRASTAACIGLAALDALAVTAALVGAPSFGWLLGLAACFSTARLTFVARSFRRVLACY
jgi:hypothetical protein